MSFKKQRRNQQDLGELESEFAAPPMPTYSTEQLERFGKWLAQFREKKQVRKLAGAEGFDTIEVINHNEAAVAFGGMKAVMHVGVKTYEILLKPTDYDGNDNPTKYESPNLNDRFNDKFDQWLSMMGRRAFAEKKRIEGYQELADTMKVDDLSPTEA